MSTDFEQRGEKADPRSPFDYAFESPYGKEVAKFIRHGIGLTTPGSCRNTDCSSRGSPNAGASKSSAAPTRWASASNIPIRTVLFTKLCKYDGKRPQSYRFATSCR